MLLCRKLCQTLYQVPVTTQQFESTKYECSVCLESVPIKETHVGICLENVDRSHRFCFDCIMDSLKRNDKNACPGYTCRMKNLETRDSASYDLHVNTDLRTNNPEIQDGRDEEEGTETQTEQNPLKARAEHPIQSTFGEQFVDTIASKKIVELSNTVYRSLRGRTKVKLSPASAPFVPRISLTENSNSPKVDYQFDQIFENRLVELKELKSKLGHVNIERNYRCDRSLGKWCYLLRRKYRDRMEGKSEGLSDDQIKILEDLGFRWKIRSSQQVKSFYEYLEDLHEFKAAHGHCNVPEDYPRNPSLAKWGIKIRKLYVALKRGKSRTHGINHDRVKILEDIGFQWTKVAVE